MAKKSFHMIYLADISFFLSELSTVFFLDKAYSTADVHRGAVVLLSARQAGEFVSIMSLLCKCNEACE